MNPLSTELRPIIEALARLNSWVRSESFRDSYLGGGPLRSIYWFKCQAIRRAALEGCAEFRRVKTRVKCNRCGGTTRWWPHWATNDADSDRCRHCDSQGMATLEFIESTIGAFVWHTPIKEIWNLQKYIGAGGGYDIELPPEERFSWVDWLPNQIGSEITISEAARGLNLVEDFFKQRPGKRHIHSREGCWEVDDFAYKLYVGETNRGRCSLCGGPPEIMTYRASRGLISWSDFACKACRAIYQNASIFEAFPMPYKLLKDEHVRQWLERRARVQVHQ